MVGFQASQRDDDDSKENQKLIVGIPFQNTGNTLDIIHCFDRFWGGGGGGEDLEKSRAQSSGG